MTTADESGGEFITANTRKVANLSKSKFISGLQCLKRLYLSCYERNLATPPDEATLAVFARGDEVGDLAQKAFPRGVLVEEKYWDHKRALAHTRQLMADESVPAIFEGAFTYEDIGIRADVLERMPDSRWRLIEAKSTTGVKDVHVQDVAIQKYVLEGCGIDLADACLMHLNKEYVYDGVEYNLGQLFHIESLASRLHEIENDIPGHLTEQREALQRTTAPDIAPGPHCTDPYTCDFYDYCNTPLPLWHVSNLYRIRNEKAEQLAGMGIKIIADIPDDFPLSEPQKRIVACNKSGLPFIDEGLQEELATLRYPVCFMDFETISPAIPRYAGMRPFSMLAFQWSVHVQNAPGAETTHYEFLAGDDSDPRENFLESLLDVLESHGEDGHIMVYNSPFEAGRLNELAEWFPKYAQCIARVQDRVWDLLPVVRQYIYHPKFNNSFSLKTVLPALVPDMRYEGMEISEGTEAGLAFERMISGGLPAPERAKIRQDLLAYCKQDTLAMVKLLDVLDSSL